MNPVKIMCFKYDYGNFPPHYCDIPEPILFLLFMCTYGVKLTVYEFEGLYDPKHLNLDPNDQNSWKFYAEKIFR